MFFFHTNTCNDCCANGSYIFPPYFRSSINWSIATTLTFEHIQFFSSQKNVVVRFSVWQERKQTCFSSPLHQFRICIDEMSNVFEESEDVFASGNNAKPIRMNSFEKSCFFRVHGFPILFGLACNCCLIIAETLAGAGIFVSTSTICSFQ